MMGLSTHLSLKEKLLDIKFMKRMETFIFPWMTEYLLLKK